jgi:hypothetical protein
MKNKYIVSKADGSPVDPKAQYLVLRLDTDPHAVVAALAYAKECAGTDPVFSEQLLDYISKGRDFSICFFEECSLKKPHCCHDCNLKHSCPERCKKAPDCSDRR